MSDYGNPPQDPNAPQNPYGQPNPYGQQPAYGQPQAPYGQPGYGVTPDYSNWFKRVGAYLIDGILGTLAALPLWIGYGMAIASAETVTNADDPYAGAARNALCPCGSGKKYKKCHGAPGGPTDLKARPAG